MNTIREISKYGFKCVIIYTLIFSMVFGRWGAQALASPSGHDVQYGDVTVHYGADNTIVDITSDQAVINWQSLDTIQGQLLEFLQKSSNSAVLNRIVSGSPTQFDGNLLANGRVFIVNPAGVIFGAGSTVNVAQLVASGLDITNQDFIDGRYEFSGGNGAVINRGTISAENVALIGSKVLNAGTINSQNGYIIMVAGERVLLGQPGSNIVVEVDSVKTDEFGNLQPEGAGTVTNEGHIEAQGGTIILAAGDIFSKAIEGLDSLPGLVEQLGTISVESEQGDGGLIEIVADHILLSGEIHAGDGGSILIDPTTLTVVDKDETPGIDEISETFVETQSQAGSNVTLEADSAIIVEDIEDDHIQGGSGDIIFRTLDDDGWVIFFVHGVQGELFATATGDIVMKSGSRGIEIGNLVTGSSNPHVPSGSIKLLTDNGGSIETGYLNVLGGSQASINVTASGDLKISGDSSNGAVRAITNQVADKSAMDTIAEICLQSLNDNITIDGFVEARAHSKNKTAVNVHIHAVGNVTVSTQNGQILAWAEVSGGDASEISEPAATASVKVHSESGTINISNNNDNPPVRARADISSEQPADITSSGDVGDNSTED
ncbi:MAG: two-partner secretion domain-containing protein, partial [Planctomycetota bacterium]